MPDVIPLRLRLAGFLSYREEQEIGFTGAQLWMLAGTNGSGKSTIFDAVTFSLFGHHRGGAGNHGELINKESNGLAVHFEFRLDTQIFQAHRTVRRGRTGNVTSTVQISLWEPREGEAGEWIPIEGTSQKSGYDRWIKDKIGLDYETFTSSVLLLQGRAEKLLDCGPKGRAEVLAKIVDLERYQKLHEQADTQRKAFKAQAETIGNQLNVGRDISEMEVLGVANQIEDAEEARTGILSQMQTLRDLETEAVRHTDLCARRDAIAARIRYAEAILTDSAKIDKEHQRYQELAGVVPRINDLQKLTQDIIRSNGECEKVGIDRNEVSASLRARDRELDRARIERTNLEAARLTDDKKLVDVAAKLGELRLQLEKLDQLEAILAKLDAARADLAKQPDDSDKTLARLQTVLIARQELGRVVLILEGFGQARTTLRRQHAEQKRYEADRAAVMAEGQQAKLEQDQLAPTHELLKETLRLAEEEATAARTLLAQSNTAVVEFEQNSGKQVCRSCGQPLTAGHFAEELQRRKMDAATAKTRHDAAAKAATGLRKDFAAADKKMSELTLTRETLRPRLTACRDNLARMKVEIDAANDQCREIYRRLPEERQGQISPGVVGDWTATAWPEADDLEALRSESADTDSVRREIAKVEKVSRAIDKLQTQIGDLGEREAAVRARLPAGEPSKIRQDSADATAEEASLRKKVEQARRTAQANQKLIDSADADVKDLQKRLSSFDSKLQSEEALRKSWTQQLETARRALPLSWQKIEFDKLGLSSQHQWKVEMDKLRAEAIEERFAKLAQARAGIQNFRQDLDDLAAQMETVPAEARRNPADLRASLAEARTQADAVDRRLATVRAEKASLESQRAARELLRKESLRLDAEVSVTTKLSQLLGRDRLQRHLVRQAEKQIIVCANGVLDRLSSGSLYLKLVGGQEGDTAERALELECCNRVTGTSPINVAFLSGSQRFRVAVSLALGIGQYASRQHRPIESVIIDEGFGCLDREGRQMMIQELQNLRTSLNCILLVSHQEEFADAFPDGYRFALEEGSTRVSRFKR